MSGYAMTSSDAFVWRVGRGEVTLNRAGDAWMVSYTSVGRLLGPRQCRQRHRIGTGLALPLGLHQCFQFGIIQTGRQAQTASLQHALRQGCTYSALPHARLLPELLQAFCQQLHASTVQWHTSARPRQLRLN